MTYWRVRGTFDNTQECGCEHCQGHVETKKIDDVVEDKSAEGAARQALVSSGCYWENDLDREDRWLSGPFVEELPQDQLMRRLGQPELIPGA